MTNKQIAANRANAQHSTGPKTEEGKKRSSLNALRHGLTGQVTTMTDEDRAAHDQFSKGIIADLKPVGAMETQLAQRIATDSWRLNRFSAIEDNIYALGHEDNSGACPDHAQIDAALGMAITYQQKSEELQRITLYEQRLNRAVQKNMALLKQLQSARKAEHEARMAEAKLLLKLSEQKGVEYQPTRDGFVFSTAEIHASIDREDRLNLASRTDFSNFKPSRARLRSGLIPKNGQSAEHAGGRRAA